MAERQDEVEQRDCDGEDLWSHDGVQTLSSYIYSIDPWKHRDLGEPQEAPTGGREPRDRSGWVSANWKTEHPRHPTPPHGINSSRRSRVVEKAGRRSM